MFPILKKELKNILVSPLSYIVLAIFIWFINFLFLKSFFVWKILTMRYYFDLLIWFLIIFIPALWMRILSEDFKSWTIEFLITKPISKTNIILWKFLSLISYFLIFIISTLVLCNSLTWLWSIDTWILLSQVIGLIFLSVWMFAISFFASSISTNQVFAFLIAVFINFTFILIWIDFIQMSFPDAIANILMQLSFTNHFNNFLIWVINLSDIFYFLSITLVSLYLSFLSLHKYQKNQKVWISIFKWAEIWLIIWIFIFVNLVVWKLNLYADLTENKVYTISEASKEILWSSDEIIDINLYVSADLPPQLALKYQQIKDLLGQFKNFSNNLVIREIHPVQDDKESETAQEWINPIQIQVLDNDQYAVKKWYFWVVLKHLWKKEIIWYLWESSNFEHLLISKILKLSSSKKEEVYLLTTSDIARETTDNLVKIIGQDYKVNTQTITNTTWSSLLYDDNKIWLVIKWKEDFPQVFYDELKKDFLNKTILMFWQPMSVDLNKSMWSEKNIWKLDELLKEKFDLSISEWIIWDTRYNSSINFRQWFISYTLPYPYFVKSFTQNELPISQWVENVTLPFIAALNSKTTNYKIEDILTTSKYGFEDKDISNLSPEKRLNINSSDLKEFSVWKTFIKDNFSLTAIPSIHLFDMVQGPELRDNILFTLNLIDWLWWDKRLIEIRSKNVNFAIFNASNEQKNWIKTLNIYVLPILLVVLWIWINLIASSRRRK